MEEVCYNINNIASHEKLHAISSRLPTLLYDDQNIWVLVERYTFVSRPEIEIRYL